MAASGLRFCARAFSSCGERGPLLIAVRGPLTVAASLVVEHRLQMCRLSNCGSRSNCGPSCSAACGIFPDQGSNPCPLHCQADSQPLHHQGSPFFLNFILFIFLYSGFILVIYFIHISVYMSIPTSHFIPPRHFPPWCPYVCSLHLCLCFCPANRFICTIFLGSTYMC